MGAFLTLAAGTTAGDTAGTVSQSGAEGAATVGGGGQGGATPNAESKPETAAEAKGENFLAYDNKWPAGFEAWARATEVHKGPQRLKQSILTPAEKQKCEELLEQIFAPNTVLGIKVPFHPNDVMFVLNKAKLYVENEPMLIEDLPFGIQVVGDIHGQLYDLDRIFKAEAKDGKAGWQCGKYLFLGDYVDRGRQSLEVIIALFCIKMLRPDDIFLLRGNHEFMAMNISYGFRAECLSRYEDKQTGEVIYVTANATFGYLSIAAIVGDAYFCAHGGISPTAFTRRQFRGLNKPVLHSKEDVLIHDTVWADPAIGLQGSVFNQARGSSVFFGADQLSHALASMQVQVLVRAHTRVMDGFEVCWASCVTIFSATDNGGAGNKGAVGLIATDGTITFRVFDVDEGRAEIERAYDAFKLKAGKEPIVDDDLTAADEDYVEPMGITHFGGGF